MTKPQDQRSDKDTNDLSDIKDVQKQGMKEKAKQIDQTPESVKDTDQGQHPQQQKR